jgi:hypothetical protein
VVGPPSVGPPGASKGATRFVSGSKERQPPELGVFLLIAKLPKEVVLLESSSDHLHNKWEAGSYRRHSNEL